MSDKPMTVDMLGAARDAQWSALAFMGPGSVRAMAPAKVNLFLGVGERRADGRHEVLTVMHALALHDTLHVQVRPADQAPDGDDLPSHAAVGGPACNLRVTVDVVDKGAGGVPDIPACENIVFRAADLLARALGQDAPCAIDVRLEKAIPHQAGLGGGSSDAAAMLLALARAWGLAADDGRLEEAAAALGADVAFFLHGGCALLDGAGERFVRQLAPLRQAVLLVKPLAGVSTAAAYEAFDADPASVPPELLQVARDAQDAAEIPLVNNLEGAADVLEPALAEVRAWALAQPGARDALLCGSGAATFVVMEDFDAACRAAAEAKRRGWWARATSVAGTRAAVLPA